MPSKSEVTAAASAVAGVAVAADVTSKAVNQVKVRIAFSGNNRECLVDLDSKTGCKCTFSGPMYPEDVDLVNKIMNLIKIANNIYPPS